jgi:hypothetical protein
MGAGVSQKALNAAIRRNLKKIQNTLAGNAIPTVYERQTVTGSGGQVSFTITYRISRASNGECAIFPVFSIFNRVSQKNETVGYMGDNVWTALDRGVERIKELWRTGAE